MARRCNHLQIQIPQHQPAQLQRQVHPPILPALNKEDAKLVKDDEEKLKQRKLRPEPKTDASKKRKSAAPKQKATDIEEETAATPSATDVEEILKVMTESLPIKLSPLGPHLTKLF